MNVKSAISTAALLAYAAAYVAAASFPFASPSTNVYVVIVLVVVVLVVSTFDEQLLANGGQMVLGLALIGCLAMLAQRVDVASDERAFGVYLKERRCNFEYRDDYTGSAEYSCPGDTETISLSKWKIAEEVEEEARQASRKR